MALVAGKISVTADDAAVVWPAVSATRGMDGGCLKIVARDRGPHAAAVRFGQLPLGCPAGDGMFPEQYG
jgi:hypothetical protein